MNDLKNILKELYDVQGELDDAAFIQKSQRLLDGFSKAEVLTAIFLEFPNSLSRVLLISLGFWFETIRYDDVLQAMLALGDKDLPAYHFKAYIPRVLGVDLRQAATEIQKKYSDDKLNIVHFADLKKLNGPNMGIVEHLRDAGADPEKIWKSLLSSGATLLPLPDDI